MSGAQPPGRQARAHGHFPGTLSDDLFIGSAADDTFEFTLGELQGSDILRGQGGFDTLRLLGAGAFVIGGAQLADVRGIEMIVTPATSTDDVALTLTDAFVASAGGSAGYDVGSKPARATIRSIWPMWARATPSLSTRAKAPTASRAATATPRLIRVTADTFVSAGVEGFQGGAGRDSVEGAASDFDGDALHGGSISSDLDHADPNASR